jgi:phosphate:Na+ symporter
MGLLLFPYFITLISNISGQASLQQKVANAHMLFNLLGVVIFLPFVPLVEKALNKVLPDKQPAPEKISVINN